jgi:acetolactate synthase-1/2/3 large subunit
MGDAKITLEKLLSCLGAERKHDEWNARIRHIVKEWKGLIDPLRSSDAVPIRPERLCRAITETLPPNAVLVSDTGYSAVWSSTMVHITAPDQRYIRAAGSLGWAFPASLGAKCAASERPVICFTGDGGFWYHLGELETARRWGIHTVTVVNNNNGLGQSTTGMSNAYGNRAGNKEETYIFQPTNFAKIAEDMGCTGIRVESPDGILPALYQALKADTPVVVDVVTDMSCKPPAVWSPK